MHKRTLAIVVISLAMIIWPGSILTVHSAGDGDDQVVETAKRKKRGGFGKFFSSIGKLFKGRKKSPRASGLSQKEIERFGASSVLRVQDSSSPRLPLSINESDARQLLTEGSSMLDSGRTSEAIALLSRAAFLDPSLAEAHNLLGVAFDRKGLRALAFESFEKALELLPSNASILNNYGYALYRAGEYKKARKRLKRAVKIAPNYSRAWNNLALTYCRLEEFGDAYKSFARAGGEYRGRLNIASALSRMGRYEQAVEHYEAALRLQPDSQFVVKQLTALYRKLGLAGRAENVRSNINIGDIATKEN